jgi:hypothetical protein
LGIVAVDAPVAAGKKFTTDPIMARDPWCFFMLAFNRPFNRPGPTLQQFVWAVRLMISSWWYWSRSMK